ncbi:pyridoxal phosphate-dependent aminotransferase [Candidatus Gracilibacteria bacterium]|nr:pyridoxal phosphate-dependent aminotransferase [Candidatus Gracilibacteria bacterium]
MLVAPYWPLIDGIVRSFHGTPVDVPLLGTVGSAEDAVRALEAVSTPRTVALYLNTPNNPSGRVIPHPWLEAIVEWATERGLWIFADEVYERYQYQGEHFSCRALAPEQTFAAYSFSKAWGMAGNRCGFMVGPEPAMAELRKIGTHTFYSAPTAAQLAGELALGPTGDAWVEAARQQYQSLGAQTAARLGLEPPEGGTFLFFDVAHRLDQRGLQGFLEDCVDHGLLLAPGSSFGPYPTHVRLCFTAVPPERTLRGVEILARLLGR